MLAIKSLSTMRELSPDYLNRFVSYVDTLLWLERSEAALQPDKPASKVVQRVESLLRNLAQRQESAAAKVLRVGLFHRFHQRAKLI